MDVFGAVTNIRNRGMCIDCKFRLETGRSVTPIKEGWSIPGRYEGFFEKFQPSTCDLPLIVLCVEETGSLVALALFRDGPLDATHHSAIKCVVDQPTKSRIVG